MALVNGLKDNISFLGKRETTSYVELITQAQKYISIDDFLDLKGVIENSKRRSP